MPDPITLAEVAMRFAQTQSAAVLPTGGSVTLSVTDSVDPYALSAPSETSQAWYWTEAWQSGEREADRDIAEGQGMYHDSDEAFLESL